MKKDNRTRKVYLVPFNEPSFYVDAYLKLYPNISIIRSRRTLLFLPLRSLVVIEDIHKWAECYLLRLDLFIIHVPRGGCSFKIGWLDTNPHFYIWLKAWRRNRIVVGAEFFLDYFREQEKIRVWQDIVVAQEPAIRSISKELSGVSDSKKSIILIMLGDRATDQDYEYFDNLKIAGFEIKFSVHPRLNIDRYSDKWEWSEIYAVISDGSISISILLEALCIKHYVLDDLLCSRNLWITKHNVYSNMIMLCDFDEKFIQKKPTKLKFDLSSTELLEVI